MVRRTGTKSEIDDLSRDKQNNKLIGNWKEVATICNYLGELLRNDGRYEDAISEHETELEMCQKIRDRMGIAIANRKIGECYCDMEEFDKAERFQRRYLEIVRELDSDIEQQRAHATLGRTYLCQAEATGELRECLTKALESFNLSLDFALLLKNEMAKKEFKEYSLMVGRLYLNLGICFELSGNFLKALKFLQDARAQITIAKNEEEEMKCLVALGTMSQKMGQLDTGQDFAKSAYALAKKSKDKAVLGETLFLRAGVSFEMQMFLESRHCLKKIAQSKVLGEDYKPKAKRMLAGLRKVQSAINHMKKSTDHKKNMKYLESVADEYCANDCFYSGMKYYKQVLELAKENGSSKSEMAAIYISLAQTSSDLKNFADAIRYSRSELALRDEPEQRCRTWLNIADYSHKSRQNDAATLNCYENAVKEAKKSGKQKLLLRCLRDQCEMLLVANEDREKIADIQSEMGEIESSVDPDEESEEEHERADRSPTPESEDLSSATDSEEEHNEDIGLTKSRARGGYNVRKNEKGETLLHTAVIQGNLKRVKQLVAQGHPVNERDHCGWLPIHEAANHNHLEIATFLIEHNASLNDPGLKECRGLTPILDAAYAGNLDMVRLLLNRGANVKCRDDDKKSIIDALMTWRKENFFDARDKTDRETEKKFDGLVADLQAAMIQAGVKPEDLRSKVLRPPRIAEKANDTSASKRNRKRSPSPNLEDNAAVTYRDAIESMKGNRRRQEKRKRAPTPDALEPVNTGPLIPAEEFVGDDWLITDTVSDNGERIPKSAADLFYTSGMRQSSGPKRKPTRSSGESVQSSAKGKNSGNLLSSFSELERTSVSPERPSRSGVDTSLIRAEKGCPSSPVIVPVTFNSSPAAPPSQVHFSPSPDPPPHPIVPAAPPMNTAFPPTVVPLAQPLRRVRVRIEDTVVLIPLSTSQHRTIAWLKEEAASRYSEMKGQKPVLHMKTQDGAMLSGLDQVRDVVSEAEELIGEVLSWSILPIFERYTKACQTSNTSLIRNLEQVLTTACDSGIVQASELNLDIRRISCLFRALHFQSNIKQLNLEGNPMGNTGFSAFIDILPSIPNLSILDVTCTDIGIVSLEALKTELVTSTSKSLQNLSELHMGHNDFSDECIPLIATILMELPSLTALTLDNCGFTSSCLDGCELVVGAALARPIRLRKLSLAFNKLQSKGVAKLLSVLPENIKTVNLACTMTDVHLLPQRFLLGANKTPVNLEEICLAHCGIASGNFAQVLDCLRTFRALRKVRIAHNAALSANEIELLFRTVKDGSVSWSDIDIGGITSVASVLPFLMSVLEDCPAVHRVRLTLPDPSDRATLVQFWKRLRSGSVLVDDFTSTISLSEF